MEPLDVVETRILGCLIEKQVTTPDNYPLTLNSLTAACNQTSNRDPVLSLDEAAVSNGLDSLGKRNLARGVLRSDSRVKKYRHLLEDTMHLHDAEKAVLCVLLLRGAQTTGEIRTRTNRLFDFRDTAHVEVTLETMKTLTPPLVMQLPRQPGQKEVRYVQLMSGEPDLEALAASAASAAEESSTRTSRMDALENEVASLRAELAELRGQFEDFRRTFL
jgi:uncharacterized protein YceH (UPF0502 family)